MTAETLAPEPITGGEFTDADYTRGMERLMKAVQELSMARSLPDVQRIVRTSARELTGCDGATFILRDNGECYYADEDAIEPLWKGMRFPMESCVSGWAMLNKDAAVISDIYQDARVPHEAYRPTFVKSMVMVPIRTLDPIGAIGNYWSHERQPTGKEIGLLQALADSTSIAMENIRVYTELEERVRDRTADLEKAKAEIHQLSISDELTGLLNRRGFFLLAEPALELAKRNGNSCLVAFLDVDGLKRVNDVYGHEMGDELIRDVAGVLRTTLGKSDIIGRMGGDEFCVLVCDPEGDLPVLRKRIFDAFQTFNDTQDRVYQLSASAGLLHVWPADTCTLEQLLARADRLMYEDKRAEPGWR
ncbi:sensor domain-containing diguanylate cyclase [Mycolicibacterium aubagnense]